MITFILNNQTIETPLPSGTTMLDFVRYNRHLAGTKIGCREGDCGACTVLVGEIRNGDLHYQSMTSCLMPIGNAQGKHIVTIEGLNMEKLSPIQEAIVEEGGTQCGFCTVGFVVSLSGFALSEKAPDYTDAVAAMDGNICRCTGYKSLERAAGKLCDALSGKDETNRIDWLVSNGFVPQYFSGIKSRLEGLQKEESHPPSDQESPVFAGGGTDLFVQRPEEMPEVSINHLYGRKEIKGICLDNEYCYIGAAATAEDMQASEVMQRIFPRIREHIKLVSSTPIRNMGTIGGNLVNASPIGDLTIFFLALDSQIVLNNNGNKRTIPLKDFYQGYKNLDKHPEEYIETLFFKVPEKPLYFNFEKVCKRQYLDIASVNTACLLKVKEGQIQEAHVSAGGVAPVPKYLHNTSRFLEGKPVITDMIQKAARMMQEEVSPISDARGSANYKRLLLRQLFYAHFLTFFPQEISLKKMA